MKLNHSLSLGLCLALASCTPQQEKDNKQDVQEKEIPRYPNVVFILADDLGWQNLSCYGSEYYQSPNIDMLAQQGMRFTNAYAACTVSSPTRASIMTGKYPARLNLTNFIPGHNTSDRLLTIPEWKKYLPLEEITIGELFKNVGYATAHFGKWHLSQSKTPPESLPYNPDKHGFEETFVTYKPVNYMPIGEWQKSGKDPHSVDTITNLALDFIDRNTENNFFLMVSHNSVHTPLKADSALIAKYAQKSGVEKEENDQVLGAMIEKLDESIGRILDKLKVSELESNTLVIFYSDNGGLAKIASQGPLRRGKGWLYEGGIRVPLIFRWPGVIPDNKVSNQMVTSNDFWPTFQYILNNDSVPENIDGVSLWPVLGFEQELERKSLYWHFPHYHNGPQCGAVRKGKYKLIEWYEGIHVDTVQHLELYDLENDIGENHNLADQMPEKAQELLNDLQHWRKQVNAQMPKLNQEYQQTKKNN